MIAGVKKSGAPKSLAGVRIRGALIGFQAVGGSSLAGPMWAKAMQALDQFLPGTQFDPPPKRQPAAPKKDDEKKKPDDNTGDTGGGGGRGGGGGGNGTDGPG